MDVSNCIRQVRYRVRSNLVMNESLSRWIKSIETVFAAHPQGSRSVLEQGQHVHATQTVRLGGIVLEYLELIPVVAINSVLSAKPHESLVILNNVRCAALRQTFDSGESWEANVIAFDDVHSHRIRTNPCLGHAAGLRTRAALGARQPEKRQGEEGVWSQTHSLVRAPHLSRIRDRSQASSDPAECGYRRPCVSDSGRYTQLNFCARVPFAPDLEPTANAFAALAHSRKSPVACALT